MQKKSRKKFCIVIMLKIYKIGEQWLGVTHVNHHSRHKPPLTNKDGSKLSGEANNSVTACS